jgi:hypothetical protein
LNITAAAADVKRRETASAPRPRGVCCRRLDGSEEVALRLSVLSASLLSMVVLGSTTGHLRARQATVPPPLWRFEAGG